MWPLPNARTADPAFTNLGSSFEPAPQAPTKPPEPLPPREGTPPAGIAKRTTLRGPEFSTPTSSPAVSFDLGEQQLELRAVRLQSAVVLVVLGLATIAGAALVYRGYGVSKPQAPSPPPAHEAPRAVAMGAPTPSPEDAGAMPAEVPPSLDAGPEAGARDDAGGPAATESQEAPMEELAPLARVPPGRESPGARAVTARPLDAKDAKRIFDGLIERADRLRERDRPEAAMDLYGRAHELRPDRVEPLAGRGLSLLDLKNHAAAQASFLQALKANDRYGPAIMGLAEAYRLQGLNPKAIEFYQRYLDVFPEGPEAAVARNNIQRLKP